VLFTPDERRALITLGGLLTLGLCVRLLAPAAPPPEGGGDSLLVVLAAEGPNTSPSDVAAPPPGLVDEGRVRINEAGPSDLTFLPRIGPVLAERIIEDRERNGPFQTASDLTRVKGIGPSTVRQLAPFVSCGQHSGSAQPDCTAIVRNATTPVQPH
jgi:competence ComEA-like helix-hairpin-helix protein